MAGISKRIDQARKAFTTRDISAAAKLHDPQHLADAVQGDKLAGGSWAGTYLKSIVYGGLDGIITTFAVVSGVAGAELGAQVIVILGVGNLLADGFSMGIGDYLSTKSEREYYDREAQRQAWEIEHVPEGQRAELRALYLEHGYSAHEAEQLVEVQTHTQARWVNAMMREELGMSRDATNPMAHAVATFTAFVIAGSLPLLVYLVGLVFPVATTTAFITSMVLSALALFGLGAAKVFVTQRNPFRSGFEMFVVGGLAAVVAYVVGAGLKHIGG